MVPNWCWASTLLMVGCVETVPLGRECADQRDSCIDVPATPPGAAGSPRNSMDARVAMPAGPESDGGSLPRDATVPRDGPELPPLTNLSFEAPGGFGSLTPAGEDGQDRAPPWVPCRIGWFVVDSVFVQREGDDTERVLATDGDSFVENVISTAEQAPLLQRLAAPLVSGQRYAVRMDVQSSADVDVALELWASTGCVRLRMLGTTGRIRADRWDAVCVSFEAPDDVAADSLMLIANPRGVPASGTRVFVDHLRADPGCP